MEATFVIIGGGIAGVSCVKTLSFLAPEEPAILITSTALVKVVTNIVPVGKVAMQFDVEEQKPENLSTLHPNLIILNDTVTKINAEEKMVETETGKIVKFKKICVCTGARPRLIADSPFVLGIRDTESVEEFSRRIERARRILVVGNGGIATEIVYKIENVDVVWAIKDRHISATFVDPGAAEFFKPTIFKGGERLDEKLNENLDEKLNETCDKRFNEKLSEKSDEKLNENFDEKLNENFDEKSHKIRKLMDKTGKSHEVGKLDEKLNQTDKCSNKSNETEKSIEKSNKMDESSEKSQEIEKSIEKSNKIDEVSEKSVEISKSSKKSDKIDITFEKSNKIDKSLEKSNKIEESSEKLDKIDKSSEKSDKIEESLEKSDKIEESLKKSDKIDKSLEKSDKIDKSSEKSDKIEKSFEKSDQIEKSFEKPDKIEKSFEKIHTIQKSSEKSNKIEKSAELDKSSEKSSQTSKSIQKPPSKSHFIKKSSPKVIGAALGPDWQHLFSHKTSVSSPHRLSIEYSCEVSRILPPPSKKPSSWPIFAELTNGKVIGCDFIVSATGVVPNSHLLGLETAKRSEDGGLSVDWKLETTLSDVFAAGDVCSADWPLAEHWMQMRLWTQAHQMGCFAAKSMISTLNNESFLQDFCFELFTHVTKFFGYKVVLLGLYNGQKLGNEYEILLRMTRGEEYVKLITKNGKLQGAVLIGDTDLEEMCENLILNQLDISIYGEDLLNPDIDIEDYFD